MANFIQVKPTQTKHTNESNKNLLCIEAKTQYKHLYNHLISLSNNKHIRLIIFVLNKRNCGRENGGKSVHGDGTSDDGMCFRSVQCKWEQANAKPKVQVFQKLFHRMWQKKQTLLPRLICGLPRRPPRPTTS